MLVPSIMLRRGYLEKVHLAQIRSEKDDILSHIGRLQPGVRDEYLRHKQNLHVIKDRLAALNARSSGSTDDQLQWELDFHRRLIQENVRNSDRIQSGKHAEYLQTRDAVLTDRIPKKAVGL